jgi:hypothetical protein
MAPVAQVQRALLPLGLFSALGVFLFAAASFVLSPLDWLLSVVPDDAFYYLQIARNLAQTGRSSADGIYPTNGYHPLWMVVSYLLASGVNQSDLLLRAAVSASLLLHLSVAVTLSCVLRSVIGISWAWVAGACWLLNPLAYLLAQQAMESMVYALALLALLSVHLRLSDLMRGSSALPPTRLIVIYGACLGAVCLARTEGIVIVGLALVWFSFQIVKATGSTTAQFRTALTAAAVCLTVLLPWLAFSWWQVDTIVQDSGAMKYLWAPKGLRGIFWNLALTVDYFVRRCLKYMTASEVSLPAIVAVLLSASAVIAVQMRHPRGLPARALRAVIVPTVVVGVTYGLTLSQRQLWWLILPCLCFLMTTFIGVAALLANRLAPRTERWIQLALVVGAIVVFARAQHRAPALYPWQKDVLESQIALEAALGSDEVIGAFNAGIPMFFGSRRVVPLDGLVNHRAVGFWQANRFDEFLQEASISVIVDEQQALYRGLRYANQRPVLTRIIAYPLTGWPTNERVVWRVSW